MATGLVVLGVSAATEFIGVEWWSPVDLARLHQRFAIVVNGHVVVGTRGTAGFFNRAVPAAGVRTIRPGSFDPEPLAIRIAPRVTQKFQLHSRSIPLYSPALVLAAFGGYFLGTGPVRRRGRCAECGYDRRGLRESPCPECGTLPTP